MVLLPGKKTTLLIIILLFTLNSPALALLNQEYSGLPDSTPGSVLPSGNLPVLYLEGTPYQMGYSYGTDAAPLIASVRDSAWATVLLKYERPFVEEKLGLIAEAVRNEITDFSYDDFINGIIDGMQKKGYSISYDDIVLINSMFSLEIPPVSPPVGCTNVAVWGNRTKNSTLLVASNYDYHRGILNGYTLLIAAYPLDKHAFVSTGVPGRLSNSFQMNDVGVVRAVSKGPSFRKEDRAFRVTDYFLGPYVAMSASDAGAAKDIILRMPLSGGSIHLVTDTRGAVYAVETTADLKAVRSPGENGEDNYLITTNHFLNVTLRPAQNPWEPEKFYPSSYSRFITAAKFINTKGVLDTVSAMELLSLTDIWNGTNWLPRNEISDDSINRLLSDGGTFESRVALPEKKVLYICGGNPGYPEWGRFVPGDTGTFSRFDLKDTPRNSTLSLMQSADTEILRTALSLMKLKYSNNNEYRSLLENFQNVKMRYWKGNQELSEAVIAPDPEESRHLYSLASSDYLAVQGEAAFIRECAGIILSQKGTIS